MQYRAVLKDGSFRWYEVLATKIRYRGEEAVQAVFIDIDERKRAEERIRASEERYRLLLDMNPAGVVIHGGGKILYANRMALSLFAAKPSDVLGKAVLEFVHPDYRKIAAERIQQIGENGGVAEPIEEKFVALDGRVMDVVVSGIPVDSFEGEPATLVVFQDITDKRRIEDALKGTEERFRAIVESSSDWIWEVDTDMVYTYASPKVKDLLGYDPEEIEGRHYLEFKDADEAGRIRGRFEETAATARPFLGIETKNLRKDGTPVVLETSGVPFFDAKGRLAGYRGIDRDITNRKKITDALGRSEERYRTTIDAMQDGIHVVGSDLRILLANKCFQDWAAELGFDTNFIGRSVLEAFPFLPDKVREEYGQVFAGGRTLVTEEKNEIAGRTFYSLTMKIPILEERRVTRVVTIVRDVTESKSAEKALKESEGRYRLLFENSPIGISVVDLETRKALYVNPAFCTMLGYTEEEFKSRSFLALTPDEARGDVLERFQRIEEGDSTFATAIPFLRKDGTVRYINCNAGPARVDGRLCSIGFHVDHTEVRNAVEERRKFQRQMQQTQKLESLGVLAGGIAHDFNNLLTGVLGNADLAKMELDAEHSARPFVHHIETATRRLADLTNQMLAYSGRGQFVVEPLHLSKLVEEMGRLLEVSISKDVDLVYEVEANLPLIKADPTQMRQVIMNLITNASEALGDRSGRIVARTGSVEADRTLLGETVLGEELPEGSYVFLEVADTGCGMDAETRAKIFDPFFTTKFTGRGLGLAAVLGIVRSHGGAIRLESEPGRGTTFRILLPVVEETGDSTRRRVETGEWRGEGTILVIDDEKAVRLVARDMLEKAGFTVLAASGGKEGLELFRQHGEEVRAVLLDLTMPKMGGEETFLALRRLRSDLPVILFSGYTERDATRQFAGKGLSGFVQKPFDSGRLLRPLRTALEEDSE
jgi:PAS domain S-box-containing protein